MSFAEKLPAIRPMGSRALMLDCRDVDHALAVFRILEEARTEGHLECADLVPAACTVLIIGHHEDLLSSAATVQQLLTTAVLRTREQKQDQEQTIIHVPVVYDGMDVAEVGAIAALSVEELITRHTDASYTVAFTGFAPGFAYLSGGDPRLRVPRRSTPRPRIPAGAVGLAGPFSGIYPRESPGGWQLLGHTEIAVWDVERENPALLLPGARVRFEAVRESVHLTAAAAPTSVAIPLNSAVLPATTVARPALKVRTPGLLSVFVDEGRNGLACLGVGPSGASDRGAFTSANWLVGNAPSAACLELSLGGFVVEVAQDVVVALAGAPREVTVTGPRGPRTEIMEQAFRLTPGETLTLSAATAGMRTVLALRGGFQRPPVLGSRSRDTLAGLGPEPVAAGEDLAASDEAVHAIPLAVPSPRVMPAAGQLYTVDVLAGPRQEWFSPAAWRAFGNAAWEVSAISDRIGLRLSGPPLTRASSHASRELPSEGMVSGAIQVPPDGQPVVFLADRPVTGGYPVIGVVHERHRDLLAQLPPGALVRFRQLGQVARETLPPALGEAETFRHQEKP